jgi:hypothetical protein
MTEYTFPDDHDGVCRMTVEKVKFVTVTRVIDDRKGIHYLDAIDENGYHWTAEMDNRQEQWLVYTKVWKKDPQQPLDL